MCVRNTEQTLKVMMVSNTNLTQACQKGQHELVYMMQDLRGVYSSYIYTHADYYTELYMDDVSTITCYGCPQALKNNATWCVHVYDPDEEVKVCINATGVASKTVVAAKLKMDEVLYWAGQQVGI